jgi:hypothetical protein
MTTKNLLIAAAVTGAMSAFAPRVHASPIPASGPNAEKQGCSGKSGHQDDKDKAKSQQPGKKQDKGKSGDKDKSACSGKNGCGGKGKQG